MYNYIYTYTYKCKCVYKLYTYTHASTRLCVHIVAHIYIWSLWRNRFLEVTFLRLNISQRKCNNIWPADRAVVSEAAHAHIFIYICIYIYPCCLSRISYDARLNLCGDIRLTYEKTDTPTWVDGKRSRYIVLRL